MGSEGGVVRGGNQKAQQRGALGRGREETPEDGLGTGTLVVACGAEGPRPESSQ